MIKNILETKVTNPFVFCKMVILHFSCKGLCKALRMEKMFYNMEKMLNFGFN